jgi:hypothetical protein
MTTLTYPIPNRDADLTWRPRPAAVVACVLSFAFAAYGLSLVAEWVRGWL